jgi:hypothetical protein
MESRFRKNFGGGRIHTGAAASKAAGSLRAQAAVEPSMSAAEIEARNEAFLAAEEIEVALAGALETLRDGRRSANTALVHSATAAARTVAKSLQSERDKFEFQCEALDMRIGADFLKERDALAADFNTRYSAVEQRVNASVSGAHFLFAEHKPNIMKATDDGVEGVRRDYDRTVQEIQHDSEARQNEVHDIGEVEKQKFGTTERDDEQRDGVDWVRDKVNKEIRERTKDVLADIHQIFFQQLDPEYGPAAEILEVYVSIEEVVRRAGPKALEGYDNEQPTIVDGFKQMLPPAIEELESYRAEETRNLEALERAALKRLRLLKTTGLQRFDALSKQAADVLQSAFRHGQSALVQSELEVRRQLEALGNEAVRQLREEDPPDPDDAWDVATDLAGYFDASADFAVRQMAGEVSGKSAFLWRVVRQYHAAGVEEGKDAGISVFAIDVETGDLLSELSKWRVAGMRECWARLQKTLDCLDLELTQEFDKIVAVFKQGIDDTIAEVDRRVAEAVKAGRDRNREAIAKVPQAMRDEAEDKAWKYDHWLLRKGRRVVYWIGGAFVAIVNLFVTFVKWFVIALVGIIVALLIGIELAIAELLVELGIAAYMIYQGLKDYKARRARDEPMFSAIKNTIGDVTGVSDVWDAVNDPYLKPWERAEKLTSGLGNVALLVHGKAISEGVVKIGTTRVPWLFRRVGMPKAAGRIEKATRFVVGLPQKVAEANMRIWKPRSIKDGLAEWFSTQEKGKAKGGQPLAETTPNPAQLPATAPTAPLTPPVRVTPLIPEPLRPPAVDIPPSPKPPSAHVEIPRLDKPQPANANALQPDAPPPAGGELARNRRQQAPQLPDRPQPPKTITTKKPAAQRGELVLEGEAANDEIEQIEVEQKLAMGQRQGPVMSARRGGGPNAPKPPVSQTSGSGGSRTRTTGPPPAAEPSRGSPEGVPDDGGRENVTASGADAGVATGGKVIQLPRVSQPAQPPPSLEISAQPKDAPVPEGSSGESTLVGKTRTRPASQREIYRERSRQEHPETEIHEPTDVHHIVLKKGGSVLSDIMREMLEAEGIDPGTDPANLVPMPSLRGEKQLPELGEVAHKEMHGARTEKGVLSELLGDDAHVAEIVEQVDEWKRLRDERLRNDAGDIPPERLEALKKSRVTKAVLEELGIIPEGADLLELLGIRTDGLDIEGSLNRLKRGLLSAETSPTRARSSKPPGKPKPAETKARKSEKPKKPKKPDKPEKPEKPVKQSSTVDARRRNQATTRKEALDREIDERKADIKKRKEEIADLEKELQPLEEQRKHIPNALKNDRRYNKLPRPEPNDLKLQEKLEARLEALNELKEELAANGELSPDIADFIDWEARTLRIRHEIEATRDANAVDEAQLANIHVTRLPAALEALRNASLSIAKRVRRSGPNYGRKTRNIGYDEIVGSQRWEERQAVGREAGKRPLRLATDHLNSVDMIANLDELKEFLSIYLEAPEPIKARMEQALSDLGDIPENLVRMDRGANGRKSNRSWEQITYGEMKEFGYDAPDVNRMRIQEKKALQIILERIADITQEFKALVETSRPTPKPAGPR